MPKSLQDRIKQTVYESARIPWYRRWWGGVIMVAGFLFIAWASVFTVQVLRYYREYTGQIPGSGVDFEGLKQDAKVDLLHNSDDPSIGPATAPVIITIFEDFQCPYCFQAQPLIKRLLATHAGDIRVIYKDFPLSSIHPDAQSAAEAGQCAHEQGKFWEFHDILFANQDRFAEAFYRATAKEIGLNITAFNECFATGKTKQSISQDIELGRTLGVVGTPTFFINGETSPYLQGYRSPDSDSIIEGLIEYIQSL